MISDITKTYQLVSHVRLYNYSINFEINEFQSTETDPEVKLYGSKFAKGCIIVFYIQCAAENTILLSFYRPIDSLFLVPSPTDQINKLVLEVYT